MRKGQPSAEWVPAPARSAKARKGNKLPGQCLSGLHSACSLNIHVSSASSPSCPWEERRAQHDGESCWRGPAAGTSLHPACCPSAPFWGCPGELPPGAHPSHQEVNTEHLYQPSGAPHPTEATNSPGVTITASTTISPRLLIKCNVFLNHLCIPTFFLNSSAMTLPIVQCNVVSLLPQPLPPTFPHLLSVSVSGCKEVFATAVSSTGNPVSFF